MENVEQMKFKNQKQSDTRSFFRSSNIFWLYCLRISHGKRILHLNFCLRFLPKTSKTLYDDDDDGDDDDDDDDDEDIVDTLLGTAGVCFR